MASDSTDVADPDGDRIICFCHTVRKKELLAAIRQGATNHRLIQERTRASTGCGGCEYDVLELLEEVLAELSATASDTVSDASGDSTQKKG